MNKRQLERLGTNKPRLAAREKARAPSAPAPAVAVAAHTAFAARTAARFRLEPRLLPRPAPRAAAPLLGGVQFMAAAAVSSRGMLSSVSTFLRTASGSSFEWAADAVGLGAAEDDGPLDSDSAFGPPEEHPLWPRFFAVWGADGAEREAALSKWRKRCGPAPRDRSGPFVWGVAAPLRR